MEQHFSSKSLTQENYEKIFTIFEDVNKGYNKSLLGLKKKKRLWNNQNWRKRQ